MANANMIVPGPQEPFELPQSALELFFERHFKKLIIVLCLVALVLGAWAVTNYLRTQTETEAAERFSSASTVADCDIVIQKYAGTPAAGNALLLKADLLWAEGKKESSVAALKEFVDGQPNHAMHVAAELGLGSKQASMGDKDAARATLNGLIQAHPDSEFAPAAQIQLGDLLWSEGKVEEAKKHFGELPRTYPGKMTAYTDEVEERIKLLSAGLPMVEVDAPPAPAAPPMAIPGGPSLDAPILTAPPTAATPAVEAPQPPPAAPAPAAAPSVPAPAPAATSPEPVAPPAPPAAPVKP